MLKTNEDKAKQLYQEIGNRDEQVGLLKIELQSVLDKFKIKSEEVLLSFQFIYYSYIVFINHLILLIKLAKFEVENHSLNQKVQFLTEETKKLEVSLEKSRDNGERLHKESEMVIANVNQWVHEQRFALINPIF